RGGARPPASDRVALGRGVCSARRALPAGPPQLPRPGRGRGPPGGRSPRMRRLAARLPALLGLAAVLLPLLGCHPIAAIEKRMARRPRPPFKRVNATVAYEITRDNPGILVIDLRRPDEFQSETGHLLHAWNIPLSRLPYRLLDLSPYREETFLVYCRGGDS